MTDSRVLVTGGAGFIGGHLSHALVQRGLDVTVYDNLSLGQRENLPAQARLVVADVRDTDSLIEAARGCDVIYHLAARVSIRDSLEKFTEDADVNLMGTLSVLRTCRTVKPTKLVFASSMAVYADSPTADPVTETAPTAPISPYGISKLASEHYVRQVGAAIGVQPIVLRFFNTYGTRQTDTPYVGVISIFVRKLLRGEIPTIFGDGGQCRDFVHVSDIVAGNLAALSYDGPGCTVNLGTGLASSINDVATAIRDSIGIEQEFPHAEARAGELRNCVADPALAETQIGYKAACHFPDRLDEVIDWLRETETAS